MKAKLLTLLTTALVALISVSSLSSQELIPSKERQALVDLFNATNGSKWKKAYQWDLTQPESTWKGVKIQDGHVVALDLHGVWMAGAIPTSIGDLTELQDLRLYSNQLTGPLPEELFSLPKLKILYLFDQRTIEDYEGPRQYTLSGTLPAVIDMPELILLDISTTDIKGSLSEMKTPKLQYFQASNCSLEALHPSLWKCPELLLVVMQRDSLTRADKLNLTGELPQDFSTCPKLQALAIMDAPNFGGEINPSIGQCTQLQQLLLQGNAHTGKIPEEIGDLSKLTLLSLSQNKLTGTIPESLANLSNLQHLYLGDNQLTGQVPERLQELTNLQTLNLKGNKLSGELPKWMGKLQKLTGLILGNNEFTGSIPAEWAPVGEGETDDGYGCPKLLRLDLAHLSLTGELPERFKNFSNMHILWLNNSNLSGDPTKVLEGMSQVTQLHIHHNNFTGSLENLLRREATPELVVLWAEHNHFSGNIESRTFGPADWGPYFRFNKKGIRINDNDFVLKDFENISPILLGEDPTEITEKMLYYPQNKLAVETSEQTVEEGKALNFVAPTLEDVNGETNVYAWYKDGQKLPDQNTNELKIAKVTKADAGVYVCKVTNKLVPDLTLETQEMIATVTTGILPISDDSSVLQRHGEQLAVEGATMIALYDATGTLLQQVSGDNLSVANLHEGALVIVVYTVGDRNYACKYTL